VVKPLAPTTPGATLAPGPVLRVRGLAKRFAARRSLRDVLRGRRGEPVYAVRGLEWELAAGECFGILGPNGAGKTTLLKMLATLVVPDAGDVQVAGVDLRRDPAAVRRLVAPVFGEERGLYWRLSARENLALFAALYGVAPREARGRQEELLRLVDLAGTGNRMVGTFSSGMKQRLLIARALLARPRVLLLDEPTRSLDPVSAREFRGFLRREVAHWNDCAVVIATHSGDEAFDVCDRVAVMHAGRFVAAGPAAALGRALAPERYALWTSAPAHGVWQQLVASERVASLQRTASVEDGWTRLDLTLPDGMNGAAALLETAAACGAPVARLERIPVTIAEIIEHAVARAGAEHVAPDSAERAAAIVVDAAVSGRLGLDQPRGGRVGRGAVA